MNIFCLIIFVIIIFTLLLKGAGQLISVFFGCPYYKTKNELISTIIKLANFKPNEIFYDLGCGSGRLVKTIADNFNVKSVGVEISPIQFIKAKFLTIDNKNIQIIFSDLRKINLSRANIVFCYLLPKFMNELENKFNHELKKGTRVITHAFPLINKKPIKIIKIDQSTLYLYKY